MSEPFQSENLHPLRYWKDSNFHIFPNYFLTFVACDITLFSLSFIYRLTLSFSSMLMYMYILILYLLTEDSVVVVHFYLCGYLALASLSV